MVQPPLTPPPDIPPNAGDLFDDFVKGAGSPLHGSICVSARGALCVFCPNSRLHTEHEDAVSQGATQRISMLGGKNNRRATTAGRCRLLTVAAGGVKRGPIPTPRPKSESRRKRARPVATMENSKRESLAM